MKKIAILSIFLIAGLAVTAQKSDEPFLTKSLSGQSISAAMVRTSGGSIHVSGVNAGEARIEVYVRPANGKLLSGMSKTDIQKKLDEDYTLDIGVAGNKLTAIAKPKNKLNWKQALSISFRIYIPQNVSTDLSTSGGSIHLDNLSGTQDFRTSGGSLHIEKLSGHIKGRTSGGSIHIKNSKDDIDLHTSGGSIHADDCSGNMTLATSGGSLRLKDLQGTIKARTSGGSVHGDDITGELNAHTSGGRIDLNALSGSVDASTSGGSIHVKLTELGKYITLSNSGGNIDLEMPGNKGLDLALKGNKIKTSTLKNFSGKMEEDAINGTLNGGGIPVKVKTSSGRINLTFN